MLSELIEYVSGYC